MNNIHTAIKRMKREVKAQLKANQMPSLLLQVNRRQIKVTIKTNTYGTKIYVCDEIEFSNINALCEHLVKYV